MAKVNKREGKGGFGLLGVQGRSTCCLPPQVFNLV